MTMHEHTTAGRAVIYSRVASATRAGSGSALALQESLCRDYARARGYDVVAAFCDHISGNTVERPAIQAMRTLLAEQSSLHGPVAVIVEDISRLARNVTALMKLRQAITAAGGFVEMPGANLGEDGDVMISDDKEDADDED